jgi:hypothetical protein
MLASNAASTALHTERTWSNFKIDLRHELIAANFIDKFLSVCGVDDKMCKMDSSCTLVRY